MEQGVTEQAIIKQSVRYNLPLPETIRNAPTLNFGLNLYYSAFFQLNRCRPSNMGTPCSITYFMYVDFCSKNDIIGEQRDDLIDILSAVDDAYLEYVNSKNKI